MDLIAKDASDGGSVDVDFGGDVLYVTMRYDRCHRQLAAMWSPQTPAEIVFSSSANTCIAKIYGPKINYVGFDSMAIRVPSEDLSRSNSLKSG